MLSGNNGSGMVFIVFNLYTNEISLGVVGFNKFANLINHKGYILAILIY
jgi:hypothetical protein